MRLRKLKVSFTIYILFYVGYISVFLGYILVFIGYTLVYMGYIYILGLTLTGRALRCNSSALRLCGVSAAIPKPAPLRYAMLSAAL